MASLLIGMGPMGPMGPQDMAKNKMLTMTGRELS